MALIVLDASVVIAVTDQGDDLHVASVEALRHHVDDELRLPASAYAECLVGPARRGTLDLARRNIVQLGIEVVPIDDAIAVKAAEIRAGARAVGLPDALVLASGEIVDADVVLTADRRWAPFARVRVLGAK
ncbi:MAG: PIN domain-containing protein [Actinobacteria bacterium]|nr:PIN domain-containing protein [Actinomycetota bacterium]